jgi:hypothetical protein
MNIWLIVLIVIILIVLLMIVSETVSQFILELLGIIVEVITSFFD